MSTLTKHLVNYIFAVLDWISEVFSSDITTCCASQRFWFVLTWSITDLFAGQSHQKMVMNMVSSFTEAGCKSKIILSWRCKMCKNVSFHINLPLFSPEQDESTLPRCWWWWRYIDYHSWICDLLQPYLLFLCGPLFCFSENCSLILRLLTVSLAIVLWSLSSTAAFCVLPVFLTCI